MSRSWRWCKQVILGRYQRLGTWIWESEGILYAFQSHDKGEICQRICKLVLTTHYKKQIRLVNICQEQLPMLLHSPFNRCILPRSDWGAAQFTDDISAHIPQKTHIPRSIFKQFVRKIIQNLQDLSLWNSFWLDFNAQLLHKRMRNPANS